VFERNLQNHLRIAITDTPAILIIGARQVGKTTLARSVEKDNYLTFDNTNTLSLAKNSPQDFIANLTKPVVIDEIQLCPEILPVIKMIIDNQRTAGQFILTGSVNIMTLPKVSESLAGRIEIITLRTLSQNEIEENETNLVDKLFADDIDFPTTFPHIEREDLFTRMLTGGYPEVISRKTESRRSDWFQSYITTILQRDVRDLANIEGLVEMPRLLSLLASRAAGLLNIAEVSRSMGFQQVKLNRYMQLLEKVFLIETVPSWSGSLKSRLVKAPKIFITDTGLLSYLQGLNLKKLNNEPTLAGNLTENFVVMELKKQIGWSETRPEMFHFRTSNDKEVDIILENRAGELVCIEVKSSSSVNKNDFKGLQLLADSLPNKFKRGIILYSGNEFLSFGEKLFVVPINALWN
jgi:uncharacterized protein